MLPDIWAVSRGPCSTNQFGWWPFTGGKGFEFRNISDAKSRCLAQLMPKCGGITYSSTDNMYYLSLDCDCPGGDSRHLCPWGQGSCSSGGGYPRGQVTGGNYNNKDLRETSDRWKGLSCYSLTSKKFKKYDFYSLMHHFAQYQKAT